MGIPTGRQTDRQTEETDRQTEETDRQTDRQTDPQIDQQADLQMDCRRKDLISSSVHVAAMMQSSYHNFSVMFSLTFSNYDEHFESLSEEDSRDVHLCSVIVTTAGTVGTASWEG